MEKTTETTTAAVTVEENPIMNLNLKRIILGLTEIGNLDIDDFKVNYSITKTIANLNTVEKAYNKTLNTLMNKLIQKDENGNFMSANNFYIFSSEQNKKEYFDAVEKLNDTILDDDVKVYKLKASDLQNIKGLKGTTMAKCHELIIDDIQV